MTAPTVGSIGALRRFSRRARTLAPPSRKGYNGAVEFRVLGPIEVWQDDQPVKLGGPKQRCLLGALLLHTNEVVSSDRLIEELWGERAPATATNLIQGYVAELRRTLGAEAILTRSAGYVLPVAEEELDALQFARLAHEAHALPPDGAAQALRTALALWRGPAPGCHWLRR